MFKRILYILFLIVPSFVMAQSSLPATPFDVDIDIKRGRAPTLAAYQCDDRVWRVSFYDGGDAMSLDGYEDASIYMGIHPDAYANQMIQSATEIVNVDPLVLDFVYSGTNLCVDVDSYDWKIYIEGVDGDRIVAKSGKLRLLPSNLVNLTGYFPDLPIVIDNDTYSITGFDFIDSVSVVPESAGSATILGTTINFDFTPLEDFDGINVTDGTTTGTVTVAEVLELAVTNDLTLVVSTNTNSVVATFGQGASTIASLALADSALQAGDNVLDLVNDSNFVTQTITNGLITASTATNITVNNSLQSGDIGSTVQAYDADLDDLADGELTVTKVGFGTGTDGHVWTSDGAGGEAWEAGGGGGNEFADNVFRIQDDGDTSKEVALQLSGLTTSTTRTYTAPDKDGELSILESGDTIDNPVLYDGVTILIDADKPFAEITATNNFTVTWTNSVASTTNTWDVRIECVGCAEHAQTWNVGAWSLGDGALDNTNRNEAIVVHGSFTNAINGFELDGDN